MPVSRMRMRPWLESKIDSNTIAGLVWVDKEKKMFSIPWKHAARHGWEMDKDACLFKQWAIHTGKFKPGVSDPDPKTWKANFRCAMNSLPDIEEVKDKSINKGCEAVRVYRMLQVVKNKCKRAKSHDGRRKRKIQKMKAEDTDDMSAEKKLYSHSQDDRITQENTIDSTANINTASPTYDVPDCSGYEVEIGPDSTNSMYANRFQVSPIHTPDYEEKAIVEITRQLELDSSQWLQSTSSGKGFLCNEAAMTESYHSPESYSPQSYSPESYNSPESQWSENSGEELELRFYTELIPGLPTEDILNYTDMWNSHPTSLPQISCLL